MRTQASVALTGCARHGDHINNVHTHQGRKEVETAARAFVMKCQTMSVTMVRLGSSQTPRAIEAMQIARPILETAGLRVIDLGAQAGLNATDFSFIRNAHPEAPPFGQGFLDFWLELGVDDKLPTGSETWAQVANRVAEVLYQFDCVDHDTASTTANLWYGHGGCWEPGILEWTNVEIPDTPSGGIIMIDQSGTLMSTIDPATPSTDLG